MSKAFAPQPQPVIMVTWSLVAGGSENYALTLARNLDRKRFSPHLCALDQGGALEPEIQALGIPYFVMHRKPGIRLELMWQMFRLFRKHRIRVVHTHHFNQLLYCLPGARLCGARVIHTEHSIECYKRPKLRKALRFLAMGCHKVLAIGEDGERVLRDSVGIPAHKLGIIKAGIDLEAFGQDKNLARLEMDVPIEVPVAAIVARLSAEKNHRILLQAWRLVANAHPDAILLVAGAGPEQSALEQLIKSLGLIDNVRLLGVRRDVARILAGCDVFVISSDREGLPIAVLEAMAASRPVVATAVGDLPSVVRHGVSGLNVPPGEQGAMSAALLELLNDPERARAFGEAGREFVGRFGLAPMVEAHQKLYGPDSAGGVA